MTVTQKISVSLLISVVLFAAFAALAFTGLFELVETRFYNPAIAKDLVRDVDADAAAVGEYFAELGDRFSAALGEDSVKRSFLPNQGAEDIFERTKIFGGLMEAIPGLQSVRFVDAAGKRIHFSTARSDVLRQDRLSVTYANYGADPADLPIDAVAVPEAGTSRLVVDQARDRLIFSFAFRDSFDAYKGSALFSLSVRAVAERLIGDGRLKVGEDLSLVGDPPGVVSGLPKVGREGLLPAVAQAWNEGARGPAPLAQSSGGSSYALISGKTGGGFFVSRLVAETLFSFPPAMKAILLASFFLTVYLVVFLFLNLRQDPMVVVRERIKRFQLSLLEEYYERKESLDWERWTRDLDKRREEVRGELKRGFGRAVGRRNEADVDALIDKSWDELIAAVGSRMPAPSAAPATALIDEGKLQDMLGRILASAPAARAQAVPAAPASRAAPAKAAPVRAPVAEPAEVEELAEAEEAEPAEVEELAEAEEAEPAEVEELAEAEEAEPSEVEELAEAEEAEPAEVEELAEAEEAEPAEVEELAEVEEAEPAEVEELEELEELAEEEAAAVEELEAPAEVELADGEAAALEELEEAEAVEAAAAVEPAAHAGRTQHSNIRVVFDENDDIPYIIETSGIELVDDDLNTVLDFLDRGGAAEPVEELEAAEGEEGEGGKPSLAMTEKLLDELARQIEFAPIMESEEARAIPDMDISSPFDTLFGSIENERIEELEPGAPAENGSEAAAAVPLAGSSAAYRPFMAAPAAVEPLAIETVEGAEDEAAECELIDAEEEAEGSGDYIVVKDGLAYVSESAYRGKTDDKNPSLRSLAQSVIGQRR